MSFLTSKFGLALCFAFLCIVTVRVLDNVSQQTRLNEGKLEQVPGAVKDVQNLEPDAATQKHVLPLITIEADRQGHFYVQAHVNHRPMMFLVDTGATVVALRRSEAERIGLLVYERDFTVPVSTANGDVRAARVELGSIFVGEFQATKIPALVLPDTALSKNLLGMNFLSNFGRVEFDAKQISLYPVAPVRTQNIRPAGDGEGRDTAASAQDFIEDETEDNPEMIERKVSSDGE